ncbi:MAG: hypothetical protein Q8R67_05955 [Rhodoferax sp.]|nr:hypothetical protein [Rhodoferax sp.]MDP3651213.1 hypothetical protein [Rhodoferax sp.]
MNTYTFIGLAVIGEITLMMCHFVIDGQFAARWNDIPSLAAILFGVSPYGRACYQWFKQKLVYYLK